jgi:signal transduction histidine kinase
VVAEVLRQKGRAAKASKDSVQQSRDAERDAETARLVAGLLPGLVARLQRLAQLETDFQAALEHEKLESLRQLAYGASHEINNPLANISTRAQTLLREETDPERRRRLATINTQAFRAHEMISDMMLFAKPPDLVVERVVASELLEEVLAELQPLAEEQGTTLASSNTDSSLTLDGDRVQLAVALKSLCVNSLEALGAGGAIEVGAARSAAPNKSSRSWVDISVRDTGPGIPPEARRHLFDPFFSGREAGRGLGLGLSKCWRIVSLHGGHIDVDNRPGQGVTFVLRLPGGEDGEIEGRGDGETGRQTDEETE